MDMQTDETKGQEQGKRLRDNVPFLLNLASFDKKLQNPVFGSSHGEH